MPKEKVTLRLDRDRVRALRELVGARNLSAAVDDAVRAFVFRLSHLATIEKRLAKFERTEESVPREILEWAAGIVERWEANKRPARRNRPAG